MTLKYCIAFLAFAFCMCTTYGQNKYEREFRIKKSQFPESAHAFIKEKLVGAKRVRFYKEIDSNKTSYEAKFKKDRLHYSVEFNKEGDLEDIEILIKEIDIPEESLSKIQMYLEKNFLRSRIRKIQQQYPVASFENAEITLRNAFQNLLLPEIKYELIVAGKKDKGYMDYEILFDATGKFLNLRKSLPPNYDHVLY